MGLRDTWLHWEEWAKNLKEGPWTIDSGIRDCVVGLNALGLNTTSSCQGHLESIPTPSVWLAAPNEPPSRADFDLYFDWIDENLKLQAAVLRLLEDFYSSHTALDARVAIICAPLPESGVFQVVSQWGDVSRVLSPERKADWLRRSQREFDAFARFLKQRFFASGPVLLDEIDCSARSAWD